MKDGYINQNTNKPDFTVQEYLQMPECLKILVDVAQILAGVGSIFAIALSMKALKETNRIKQSDNLIELRRLFSEAGRSDVHKWIRDQKKIQDWSLVDDYLGVFELCEVLIQQGNLDEQYFKEQYQYRIKNILNRDEIVYYKLIAEYDAWKRFYHLIDRLYPSLAIYKLQAFAEDTLKDLNASEIDVSDSDELVVALNNSDHGNLEELLNGIREELDNVR